jgi:predicted DNA binding CopG/RHH family protein
MDVITKWENVPRFDSEKEEATFWATHRVDIALLEESVSATDQAESTTITLRMDPRMLARLKRLARLRFLNYQSMIKQWVAERLDQELRGREK